MARPQTRFLLRGSLALIGMLLLWWLLLLEPMLGVLRVASSIPLSLLPGSASEPILDTPSGDWTIQVPVSILRRAVQRLFGPGADGASMRIRFVKLKLPRAEIAVVTAGLPLYWAILLASPGPWRHLRAWVWGTGLLSLVAILSLLVYAGYTIESKLHLLAGGLVPWALEFRDYLAIGVLPYVAPCLVAFWLQDDLRRQVFSWTPQLLPAPLERGASRKEHRAANRQRSLVKESRGCAV
jgi:hypothetical protein